jgi:hypothetical protein
VSKPFLSTAPVLAIREAVLDGQAIRVRDPSMLEASEYSRRLRQKGMVEAVAYYIERRLLNINGEPLYTEAEALAIANMPTDRSDAINAIIDVLTVKKTEQSDKDKYNLAPIASSDIVSPSH